MPKARFEIPGDLTKEISEVTKNHYRAKLNRLAAAGFLNRTDLLEKQTDVCAKIRELSGEDDGAARQYRRMFLSAVFWILHERPLDQKKMYYDEFQKSKDNYTAPVIEADQWKDIPDMTPYQAHPSGLIRRCWAHKKNVFKSTATPLGYHRVSLTVDGKRKSCYVAHLIAKTFIPNPDNKPEIDHLNNDRGDNRAENLRWATRSEQVINRRAYSQSGIKHINQRGKKWCVTIGRDKKTIFQKLYDTKEDAIKARDEFLATLA